MATSRADVTEFAAGEQGHVVALAHQLFAQKRDHAFRAAIEPGRNALHQRGDLSDFHGWVSLGEVEPTMRPKRVWFRGREQARPDQPAARANFMAPRSLEIAATLFPQPRRGSGPLCGFSMLRAAPLLPAEPDGGARVGPRPVPPAVVERHEAVTTSLADDPRRPDGAILASDEDEIVLDAGDAPGVGEPDESSWPIPTPFLWASCWFSPSLRQPIWRPRSFSRWFSLSRWIS